MEAIVTPTQIDAQGELSPTHPDPTQRVAHWQAVAKATIEDSARLGLAQAIEWALSDAWYDGIQEGIRVLAAAQRQTRDAAKAKAAAEIAAS